MFPDVCFDILGYPDANNATQSLLCSVGIQDTLPIWHLELNMIDAFEGLDEL